MIKIINRVCKASSLKDLGKNLGKEGTNEKTKKCKHIFLLENIRKVISVKKRTL